MSSWFAIVNLIDPESIKANKWRPLLNLKLKVGDKVRFSNKLATILGENYSSYYRTYEGQIFEVEAISNTNNTFGQCVKVAGLDDFFCLTYFEIEANNFNMKTLKILYGINNA